MPLRLPNDYVQAQINSTSSFTSNPIKTNSYLNLMYKYNEVSFVGL